MNDRIAETRFPCIYRAGCNNAENCQRVGHCTSADKETLDIMQGVNQIDLRSADQSLRLSDDRIAKLIELWSDTSNAGSMWSDAVLGLQELSNRRAAEQLRLTAQNYNPLLNRMWLDYCDKQGMATFKRVVGAEIDRLQRDAQMLEIVGREQEQRIAQLKGGNAPPAAPPDAWLVIEPDGWRYLSGGEGDARAHIDKRGNGGTLHPLYRHFPVPAEPPYRVRAFWSPCRQYLVTAYVSSDDITLMDDDGSVWEPSGPEQDVTHHEHCDVNDPIIKGKPCNCKIAIASRSPGRAVETSVPQHKFVEGGQQGRCYRCSAVLESDIHIDEGKDLEF